VRHDERRLRLLWNRTRAEDRRMTSELAELGSEYRISSKMRNESGQSFLRSLLLRLKHLLRHSLDDSLTVLG